MLPKPNRRTGNKRKASIAFFIIAQLILAVFASSTAIAASIKYDDSYTYEGSTSSDAIAWGGSSLKTKLNSYPSNTMVTCLDFCNDGTIDKCYGSTFKWPWESKSPLDKCKSDSSTLKSLCNAGKCSNGGVGDWQSINTGSAGDRWKCSIWSRYYYDCTGTGSYNYDNTPYAYTYYIIYPRRYDCDEQKISTYDDEMSYGSTFDFKSDISCSGSRLCDEDKDDGNADFGLYGTSKPNEPCSVPDGNQDCDSDSDCFSGSKCDCSWFGSCSWDVWPDGPDYCCPSGQKWDGSKCATPCKDSDSDGHKDNGCGGDDCNDNDGGVWQKNSCQVCAKEPSGIGNSCTVGVGACQRTGKYGCDSSGTGTKCDVTPGSPSTETCDGVDNDCDGQTDEGVKNACGGCGPVPAELCNDGKDNDCDGKTDGADTDCCPSSKPYYWNSQCQECPQDKTKKCGSGCYSENDCGSSKVAICDKYNKVMCCPSSWPFYCARTDTCSLNSQNCDNLKKCGNEGWTFCANSQWPHWNCRSDGKSLCCQAGTPYWWESDKQCHKSSEPPKCSVPDGSSSNCDCNTDSQCKEADASRPYCGETYSKRESSGFHACLSSKPEYCGNGKCAGSENYNNCASDCGSLAPKGTITVAVEHSKAKLPIKYASIFVDDIISDSTDQLGKAVLKEVPYGVRRVKVECLGGSLCGEQTRNIKGWEFMNFACECSSGDLDGDEFSDEDEILIGTDPYDAKSYPEGLVYNPVKCVTDAADIILVWLKGGDLLQSHSAVMQALSSPSVVSTATGENQVVVLEALQQSHFDARLDMQSEITVHAAVERAEYIDAILTKDEMLFVISDNETQTTAIKRMGASCVGTIIGAAYGVGKGVDDDLKLLEIPVIAVKALIFVVSNLDELNKVRDGFMEMVDGFMEMIKNFDFDSTRYNLIKFIFGEGRKTNPYSYDAQDMDAYYHYQLGFFSGYVTGYIVEQVIFLKVAFAVVKNAFKVTGKLLSRLAGGEKIAEQLAAVAKYPGLGAEIAKKVNNLPYVKGAAQLWTGDELVLLGKLTKYNENWMKTLTKAEAQNVLKLTKNIPDANLEKLVSSKLGQQTLKAADATEGLIAKQSKLVQKWGVKKADEVVSKGGRVAERTSDLNKLLKAMPEGFIDDFSPEKAVKFLGDKKFVEAAEDVTKGVDNLAISRVVSDINGYEKLLEYTKAVKKLDPAIVNPLGDIGQHQVLKVMTNSKLTTKVGDTTIDGMAVLKKGVQGEKGWGWEHISKTRPDGINHAEQIQKALDLPNADGAVQKVINEVIENPDSVNYIKGDSWTIVKSYNTPKGIKKIQVVVSDIDDPVEKVFSRGSVQTAHPIS
ncbi:putative metal-binding motif-containing protein [Candidatus Woesearchaeota archaeon]|nr:putative metal-binding motif-containing protein [Candidatus Woesearchaeota archaeon]